MAANLRLAVSSGRDVLSTSSTLRPCQAWFSQSTGGVDSFFLRLV